MRLVNVFNPYALAMAVRRKLYGSGKLITHRVGVPVISIGNLTLGGTGKTPTTIYLARYLTSQHKKKVAVVLRGYKRETVGYRLVSEGNGPLLDVGASGDEAYLLSEELIGSIVIVDENRVRGAEEALKLGADVVLLDDAYQHMRIHRDLNLLVVNAERPLAAVLPFGGSREDVSASSDADFLLLTNASDEEKANKVAREISIAKGVNIPFARVRSAAKGLASLDPAVSDLTPLSELNGKRVLAIASIARPERFTHLLSQHGATVELDAMGDHSSYDRAITEKLIQKVYELRVDMVVTTQKDAVKSRGFFLSAGISFPMYVLAHEFEFLSGERALLDMVDHLFVKTVQ